MKWISMIALSLLLMAGCGSGNTANTATGNSDSACSADLSDAEREAKKAGEELRDKLRDLKTRSVNASEDSKEALVNELDELEDAYKDFKDKMSKLGDDGKEKLKDIQKEIDDLGEEIEDALKPE
ncbi:MAG: hypothetical protein R3E76_11890 [Planctomycetota bacterium]